MTEASASPLDGLKDRILEAALPHVPFDGWSDKTLREAAKSVAADDADTRAAFPRGVIDLVVHYAETADAKMLAALKEVDLVPLRVRERIALAVRLRIEAVAETKDASRRAAAIFALPLYAFDGAQSVYRTCDLIWRAIGDTSADFNFYTKRALLSGVITTTMLYWFGDQSEGSTDTWAFLDRRIADVMQFEKLKAAAFKFGETIPNPLNILGAFRYPKG